MPGTGTGAPLAAAQTSLRKMYTFVYRTFIKFILFCRGQALDVGLSCYPAGTYYVREAEAFQCPHGLELLRGTETLLIEIFGFQCPHGLELLQPCWIFALSSLAFQCPHGLELLHADQVDGIPEKGFNALMGLSCYGKNVQYFKFFMILFMHPCYL